MPGAWTLIDIPRERQARWEWLDEFLARWWRARVAADGLAPKRVEVIKELVGPKLPAALVEFHARLGRAHDIVGFHNKLAELPDHPDHFDEPRVYVWHENQNVVSWAINLAEGEKDDPAVDVDLTNFYGLDDGDPDCWKPQDKSFSAFAVHMLIAEAVHGAAKFTAHAAANPGSLALVRERLAPLTLAPWLDPGQPSVLYGRDDVLVETDAGDGDDGTISLASTSATSFSTWKKLLGEAGLKWKR